MRAVLALAIVLLSCLATAQGQEPPASGQGQRPSLFLTAPFDLIIKVTKHQLGADVIEITALKTDYPAELLREQVERLGESLNSQPRGLSITRYEIPGDSGPGQPRATFAVDGLVQREQARLGLQPLVRAFAGAPEPHTVRGLTIQYESEAPGADTIRRYSGEHVEIEGQAHPITGLEYRVVLRSQNAEDIVIPEGQEARDMQQQKREPAPERGPDWLIIGVFAVATLAVGALVYSLLLRPAPKGRKR
jgi:hypothetical protein